MVSYTPGMQSQWGRRGHPVAFLVAERMLNNAYLVLCRDMPRHGEQTSSNEAKSKSSKNDMHEIYDHLT